MYSIHLRLVLGQLAAGGHALDGRVDALLGRQQRRRVDGGALDHRDDVDERLVVGGLEGPLQVRLGEVLGCLRQRLAQLASAASAPQSCGRDSRIEMASISSCVLARRTRAKACR